MTLLGETAVCVCLCVSVCVCVCVQLGQFWSLGQTSPALSTLLSSDFAPPSK